MNKFFIRRMSAPDPAGGTYNMLSVLYYLSKIRKILNLEAHLSKGFQRSICESPFLKAQRNSQHPWDWGIGEAPEGPPPQCLPDTKCWGDMVHRVLIKSLHGQFSISSI